MQIDYFADSKINLDILNINDFQGKLSNKYS